MIYIFCRWRDGLTVKTRNGWMLAGGSSLAIRNETTQTAKSQSIPTEGVVSKQLVDPTTLFFLFFVLSRSLPLTIDRRS